jgi:hypothetical protein
VSDSTAKQIDSGEPEPVAAIAASDGAPSADFVADLRSRVLDSLERQGFRLSEDGLLLAPSADKNDLRTLHAFAVRARQDRAKQSLLRHEDRLLAHFASGEEVDPASLSPRLRLVAPGSEEELLFRYARLHWSVPVSAGYGRRLRFVVVDGHNDKLVGLIGLGDPVIRMAPRDRWVGWDGGTITKKLRHVMDAFVLGAVPPYSELLCGKLVAMLAASSEIRDAFKDRYKGTVGRISGEPFNGDLALITTQSALGRSSLYNRLRIPGSTAYVRVGETSGSGEFHFSNGVYADLLDFARQYAVPTAKHAAWGEGFRNRREVVRAALPLLGLNPDLVYHGVRREVYCVPLASNTREYLRGEDESLIYWTRSAEQVGQWFRERWLLPRADRVSGWQHFEPSSLKLWGSEGGGR